MNIIEERFNISAFIFLTEAHIFYNRALTYEFATEVAIFFQSYLRNKIINCLKNKAMCLFHILPYTSIAEIYLFSYYCNV